MPGDNVRQLAAPRNRFPLNGRLERRLIAERTRDGMANARTKGSRPGRPPLDQEKLEAAILLVKSGMSPTKAARQIGLGRSTLYREIQGQSLA